MSGVAPGHLLGNAQTLLMRLENGWPSVRCGTWQIDDYPSLRPAYVEERIAYASTGCRMRS